MHSQTMNLEHMMLSCIPTGRHVEELCLEYLLELLVGQCLG